jgi:hypothetical protein
MGAATTASTPSVASLIFLVGDFAHLAQACPGTSESVLELENFDL